jgi:hypothetical protein
LYTYYFAVTFTLFACNLFLPLPFIGCIFAVMLGIVVVLFVLNRRGHLQPPAWLSRQADQAPIVPPGQAGFGPEEVEAGGGGTPGGNLDNPVYGTSGGGFEVDAVSAWGRSQNDPEYVKSWDVIKRHDLERPRIICIMLKVLLSGRVPWALEGGDRMIQNKWNHEKS